MKTKKTNPPYTLKKLKEGEMQCLSCDLVFKKGNLKKHNNSNKHKLNVDKRVKEKINRIKKVYVITMMVNFPKEGIYVQTQTGFKKKILSGEKKHTLRQNYEFWKKRIDEINAGKAILSVRQWSGLPYRSEQKEIKQFGQGEVGYERVVVLSNAIDVSINTGKGYVFLSDKRIKTLAKNDGVPIDLFRKFFKHGVLDGIIIHFTKLRYSK